MIFVGIDQAIRKCGVCVLDGNKTILELVKPNKGLSGTQRLINLRDKLLKLLNPYREIINNAAIEGPSIRSINLANAMGHASCLVQIVLSDLGVKEPLIVPPCSLKKFVAGNGNATKQQMALFSKRAYGLTTDNDDLCDAHGLAQYAKHSYNINSLYATNSKKTNS